MSRRRSSAVGLGKVKKERHWYAICVDCSWQSDWCATPGQSMDDAEKHSQARGHKTRAGLVEVFRIYHMEDQFEAGLKRLKKVSRLRGHS